jgi:hypothetical protein
LRELREGDRRVDSAIPDTKIRLLYHQTYTVAAMLDLERRYCAQTEDKFSNAGVLSERLGSGKTYEILGLIGLSRFPGFVSEISYIPDSINSPVVSGVAYGRNEMPLWRRQYQVVHQTNLIFIGKSVINQWREKIEELTSWRCWIIDSVMQLKKLYDWVFGGPGGRIRKLNAWDIILVKNGSISGNFIAPELEGSHLEHTKSRSIICIFGILFRNQCFGRIILDDFDTLGINGRCQVIPSIFTWYVSATIPKSQPGRNTVRTNNIWQALEQSRPLYNDVTMGSDLFHNYNVRCCEQLINASVQVSAINHILYEFDNPHDSVLAAMAAIGSDESHNLSEMINAGAIHMATAKTGGVGLSVAGIFERLLRDQWNIYKQARAVIVYVPRLMNYWKGLPEPNDESRAPNQTELSRNIKHGGPLRTARKLVTAQYKCVETTATAALERATVDMEKSGKAIERVKDNIKHGECAIMLSPLEESPRIYIMSCCSVMLSEDAITNLKFDRRRTDVSISCPKCRSIITGRDVICINCDQMADILEEKLDAKTAKAADGDLAEEDADAEDMVEEPADEESAAKSVLDEVQADSEIAETIPDDPKYKCIVDILNGTTNAAGKRIDAPITGLLEGPSRGVAPPEDRKYLIFSNYGKAITGLENMLTRESISYRTLGGTASMIAECVRRYNLPNSNPRSYKILLVHGVQYCAGLNLQITSDVIFTHMMVNREIEAQLGGRAARHGRRYDLNMHYVYYKNECRTASL